MKWDDSRELLIRRLFLSLPRILCADGNSIGISTYEHAYIVNTL